MYPEPQPSIQGYSLVHAGATKDPGRPHVRRICSQMQAEEDVRVILAARASFGYPERHHFQCNRRLRLNLSAMGG